MVIGLDASRAFVAKRSGTENYSYQLLRAMIAAGSTYTFVVYTRGEVAPPKDFVRKNVRFREIGWPRLWTQGGLALASWRDTLDVLFIPAHTLPVLRRPKLPTVVTIHGLEYEYLPEHYRFPQKIYLTWSTRYAVRFATTLIAVSQFTKKELVKRLRADENTISVVHEGVDAEVYSKSYNDKEKSIALEALGVLKPYVLFVGVVQPRKNLVRLIKAFSQLTGSIPVNLSLVIAGNLGWMYRKILAAPKKYGVKDRVKFVGFVDEKQLPILMQEAEILVQPSLTEGFGLPVLEAMAAGTPVVVAKAGALPEVVGRAGILVDPLSVDDLAQGMAKILVSQTLRNHLRERGLSWCRRFSWKRAADETLGVLRDAAEKSKQ
ncbi:glycosyltransferase family 4 protein [Patescibacteria group bacterium]|nr:glycosyltransferase family 4 protein [Patescibacteria group bacterium]